MSISTTETQQCDPLYFLRYLSPSTTFLRRILVAGTTKRYSGLCVNFPIFFSVLTRFVHARRIFIKVGSIQISRKAARWEPRLYTQTDRQTDMTNFINVFHDYSKAIRNIFFRVPATFYFRLQTSWPTQDTARLHSQSDLLWIIWWRKVRQQIFHCTLWQHQLCTAMKRNTSLTF
jgi:hypothetical protein